MRVHQLAASAAIFCATIGASVAHEVEEGKGKLGKVAFANSCDAKVQGELQRAVAMLHSFWFSAEVPSATWQHCARFASCPAKNWMTWRAPSPAIVQAAKHRSAAGNRPGFGFFDSGKTSAPFPHAPGRQEATCAVACAQAAFTELLSHL